MTPETLRLEKCRKQVHWFAASLFRLALTAFLDLRLSGPADDRDGKRFDRNAYEQRLSEDAILIADESPDQQP